MKQEFETIVDFFSHTSNYRFEFDKVKGDYFLSLTLRRSSFYCGISYVLFYNRFEMLKNKYLPDAKIDLYDSLQSPRWIRINLSGKVQSQNELVCLTDLLEETTPFLSNISKDTLAGLAEKIKEKSELEEQHSPAQLLEELEELALNTLDWGEIKQSQNWKIIQEKLDREEGAFIWWDEEDYCPECYDKYYRDYEGLLLPNMSVEEKLELAERTGSWNNFQEQVDDEILDLPSYIDWDEEDICQEIYFSYFLDELDGLAKENSLLEFAIRSGNKKMFTRAKGRIATIKERIQRY